MRNRPPRLPSNPSARTSPPTPPGPPPPVVFWRPPPADPSSRRPPANSPRLVGPRPPPASDGHGSATAGRFGLDPDGPSLNAPAPRGPGTGVPLNGPADGGGRL